MRKWFLTALVVALAGCGTADSGRDTVTLWMYPVIEDRTRSEEFWRDVETGFEARYGVDLEVELQPWRSREEKLGAALMSRSGPDVVLLQPDMIPQYVAQGALQPVGDVVTGAERAFRPSALAAVTVGDQAYGVPLYQTVTTTVYNRKLFAEAGITELPRTWDEVRAAAPKLAARGVPVLDYSGSTESTLNLTFYPLLWQAGGTVFSADGTKSAFDSPQGIEALRFLVDLENAGGLPDGAATKGSGPANEPVVTGRAAMAHAATAAQARAVIAGVGEQDTVIGAPLRGRVQATFGMPGAVTLLRAAKNPDAARHLLTYLASPRVTEELCARSGYFQPWTTATSAPADAVSRTFTEALPFANAGDTHPRARKVMSLLAPHLQAALLGRATPEQALAEAAREVDAMLGRG
ncbi:ABC transporter substrate-binding protein [Lentzea californiensis]|uniref:ABC transporter substrate-binding protein n=1 Tax=Lentzea californiensis TaxID=438851 RepID=UPI00216569E3|nr:sugar ABC transporter substrate-binding protein [Lentzea californiensis]MCR3751157.1 multiple sugar transport system substrate-binding protein [Lentzea californiensis]